MSLEGTLRLAFAADITCCSTTEPASAGPDAALVRYGDKAEEERGEVITGRVHQRELSTNRGEPHRSTWRKAGTSFHSWRPSHVEDTGLQKPPLWWGVAVLPLGLLSPLKKPTDSSRPRCPQRPVLGIIGSPPLAAVGHQSAAQPYVTPVRGGAGLLGAPSSFSHWGPLPTVLSLAGVRRFAIGNLVRGLAS